MATKKSTGITATMIKFGGGISAARALPIECIEVRTTGTRGGVRWEPLAERAARTEQQSLW